MAKYRIEDIVSDGDDKDTSTIRARAIGPYEGEETIYVTLSKNVTDSYGNGDIIEDPLAGK